MSSLSWLNNLKIYKFLDHHKFIDFYCFTVAKDGELFRNSQLNVDSGSFQNAQVWHAVRQKDLQPIFYFGFSQDREIRSHWIESGRVKNITEIFKINEITDCIYLIMKSESLIIAFIEHISKGDLNQLKDIVIDKKLISSRCL